MFPSVQGNARQRTALTSTPRRSPAREGRNLTPSNIQKGSIILGKNKSMVGKSKLGTAASIVSQASAQSREGSIAAEDITSSSFAYEGSNEGTPVPRIRPFGMTVAERMIENVGASVTGKGALLALSDEIRASFWEELPIEVQLVINRGDAWQENYSGGFDPVTGYSWVSSPKTTFIWKHHRSLAGPPTTHIFPSPPSSTTLSLPPQVILLPATQIQTHTSQSNEPALVLTSPSGHVHFWPSIYLGLAGADKFFAVELPLSASTTSSKDGWDKSETITRAERIFGSPSAFSVVAGTSRGRIFRIHIGRRVGEGGRWEIQYEEFGIPKARSGVFSFLGFGASSQSSVASGVEGEGINGIAIAEHGTGHEKQVWVLTSDKLLVWLAASASNELSPTDKEKLIHQADVISGIQDELLRFLTREDDQDDETMEGVGRNKVADWERKALQLEIELLDIALVRDTAHVVDARSPTSRQSSYTDDGTQSRTVLPVLLVSFWNIADGSEGFGSSIWGATPQRERMYATIGCWFDENELHSSLNFTKPDILPYTDNAPTLRSFSRAPSRALSVAPGGQALSSKLFMPRIIVLQGWLDQQTSTTILATVFDGGLVLSSNGHPFHDHLFLKTEHPFPRSLGIGAGALQPRSNGSGIELVYVTSMGSVIVALDWIKINSVDSELGGSQQVQSVMRQAIKYGKSIENPFVFRLPPNVESAHLMQAAHTLSREAINSIAPLIRPILDLKAHLTYRANRLQWLIQFINENGALGKLSPAARWGLSADAEKIAGVLHLWEVYTAGLQNVLVAAVDKYIEQDDRVLIEGDFSTAAAAEESLLFNSTMSIANTTLQQPRSDADPLRAFFRVRVREVGKLISFIVKVVRDVSGNFGKAQGWKGVAVEGAKLVLALLTSALDFRKSHKAAYGLDLERPAECPWTAEVSVMDACVYLFDECTRSMNADAKEAKEVIKGLATVVCEGYRDRLAWMKTTGSGGGSAGWTSAEDAFVVTRRSMWRVLVRNNAEKHAFKLAEYHGDFRALIELSYETTSSSDKRSSPVRPDPNITETKLEHYIETYKEPFAFELYQYWIEQGQAAKIFRSHEKTHPEYVDKFWQGHDHPRLSWLSYIGKEQYAAAASTLLGMVENGGEDRIGCVTFMLSVGKLCELAEGGGAILARRDEDDNLLEDYHRKLDFVAVLNDVRTEMEKIISAQAVKHVDIESKTAVIVETLGKKLSETGRSGYLALFKSHVHTLLGGKTITLEDAIDLLSLKDHQYNPQSFEEAIVLLARTDDAVLPNARRISALRSVWRRIYIADDWHDLQNTRSYTDAQLATRLQSTALFQTLRAIHTGSLTSDLQPSTISELILSPREAMLLPTTDEMVARFAGDLEPTAIKSLYEDLSVERTLLEEVIIILETGGMLGEIVRFEEQTRQDAAFTEELEVVQGLGLDVEMVS